MVWLVFTGLVISEAYEWEDYFSYFREGAEVSRTWAPAYFLIFDGEPQNHRDASECVP